MRGHIRSRGDRRWQVVIKLPPDAVTGARRQLTRIVHGTRRDAERVRTRLLAQVDAGDARRVAATVGELLDRWYAHVADGLSPSTRVGYESKLRLYLRPGLGAVRLEQLTPARLDHFYRELAERGGAGGTALSPSTVRHVHRILHRALAQAVRWEWLARNPASIATPPGAARDRVDAPPEREELRRIFAALTDLPEDVADLVHLAVATGARRGELGGLRWADLDVDAGEVLIGRAVVYGPGRTLEVKLPKSGRRRRIALDAATVAMLERRRLRCRERALAAGVRLARDGYIFSPDPSGARPVPPDWTSSAWRRVQRATGTRARFHDLRHLAATHLLERGVDPVAVAARLGHDPTMTLQVYGHARRAADQRAADLLGELAAGD